MTGSHEVRGSIPLGSTNHFKGNTKIVESGLDKLIEAGFLKSEDS